MLVCIGGLGLLVASDKITEKDYPAVSLVKGDIFMLVGATLYGFSKLLYLGDFSVNVDEYCFS